MQTSVHMSNELTSQTPAQIPLTTLCFNQTSLQNHPQLPLWQLHLQHHQYDIFSHQQSLSLPADWVDLWAAGVGELAGCLVGWLTCGFFELWVGWWVNLQKVWWVGWLLLYLVGGLPCEWSGGWTCLWFGKWVDLRAVWWVGWLAVYLVWRLTCTLSCWWFMSGFICRQVALWVVGALLLTCVTFLLSYFIWKSYGKILTCVCFLT